MTSISHWILSYLLNSIWQVALIAAVSLAAFRLMRPASWQARHLLAIVALVAAIMLPAWSASTSMHPPSEKVAVTILPFSGISSAVGPASSRNRFLRHFSGSLPIAPPVSRIAALLYLAFLLYRAGVLLVKWRATRRLLASATPATLPEKIATCWERWIGAFRLSDISVLTSELVAGPVTLGLRRPALLVPPDFLSTATREEAEAALCHEFAHIARRDFLVNLLLEITSLPIVFHPACWLLKRQIDESRELICDAMAAHASTGSDSYARSLLSLARSICAPPRVHQAAPATNALGIFEANILEKRIMNLIDPHPAASRFAKLAATLLGGAMLASTAIGISAFSIHAASAQTSSELSPYLGTWKTSVNGKPAAIVQIFEYQGKLTGSVSNGDFGVDEKNNNAITGWSYGTPGGAPIVEASISGQTLAFKTLDASGTVPWELALTAPGKAELRVAEALPNGSKLPAIPAERVEGDTARIASPEDHSSGSNENSGHPRLISSVDPEYSPQARAAKFSGVCVVSLTVDTNGMPTNVHVVKPLGMGLDEMATKAVNRYRFAPAMRDGATVPSDIKVEVSFRYY
jgi:TonB family protein